MLDIQDKNGNVVAVILDDGTVVKRENTTDDMDKMIQSKIKSAKKGAQ